MHNEPELDAAWNRRRFVKVATLTGALAWTAPVVTSVTSPAAAGSVPSGRTRPTIELVVLTEDYGDQTEHAFFELRAVVDWKGLPPGDVVWSATHFDEFEVSDDGFELFFSVIQSDQSNPTTASVFARTVDPEGHTVVSDTASRSWPIQCPYFDEDGNRLIC
jgi:hypothetical protein